LISIMCVFALTACGGGSGAPNNPYKPVAVVLDLKVQPNAITIYAKVPATLLISGGTPPYRAFSSNTLVLPVTQAVSGNTLRLLASPVASAMIVTFTIADSGSDSVQVELTVLPELTTPPPDLVVLPTSLDVYAGTPAQLAVSGGLPPYRAFSSNPGVLP